MSKGWIGVDLDGTLAYYEKWVDAGHIGEPIKPMVERVKKWLAAGEEVRIFTARVYTDGSPKRNSEVAFARMTIEKWCQKHLGQVLPITCVKDFAMKELWDDRAVRVAANLGMPCGYVEFGQA